MIPLQRSKEYKLARYCSNAWIYEQQSIHGVDFGRTTRFGDREYSKDANGIDRRPQ
jgi:hypothetical protein